MKGVENQEISDFRGIIDEIEGKPLKPIVLYSYFLIIFLLIAAVLWMYFGKTDIVINARGKIIPQGGIIVIQSIDKGILNRLDVTEGEKVKKGQNLGLIIPGIDEPMLENENLLQQENMALEELAGTRVRLNAAKQRAARLNDVKDIIRADDFENARQEVSVTEHEVTRLEYLIKEIRNKRKQQEMQTQRLTAPVDGVVDRLYIQTQGAVVTPAQNILSIIPDNAPLEIKALVRNEDIGFVKTGMPVSIKVDAFNFQKYGMIDGKVRFIAQDSIFNENLGNVYEIYITPDKYSLNIDGRKETLKSGMTTSNEIIIGKRRIIDFFNFASFPEAFKIR